MASEVKVLTWCDQCLGEDTQVPAESVVLEFSISGSKPARIEVDLCDRHRKEVTTITEWLTTVGRRSKGTAEIPAAPGLPLEAQVGPFYTCPAGCGRTDLAKRTGLIQHLKRTHGLELEEAQRQADLAMTSA